MVCTTRGLWKISTVDPWRAPLCDLLTQEWALPRVRWTNTAKVCVCYIPDFGSVPQSFIIPVGYFNYDFQRTCLRRMESSQFLFPVEISPYPHQHNFMVDVGSFLCKILVVLLATMCPGTLQSALCTSCRIFTLNLWDELYYPSFIDGDAKAQRIYFVFLSLHIR